MSEPNPSLEEFLFEAALGKASEAERAAFLDGVCRDNPALRARLEVLLEGQFQAQGFLTSPTRKVEPKPAPLAEEETASTFIGRYKLLEKIGEGGFGEVWMAEQKEPVKRRVALKIIKLGMDTKQVVARFEAERQALALMDHPNIAKVFDGGATETGRPYFVMELVRGVRITEYCDQSRLPTQERLKLFVQVCHAIQHAHQKGIIHRDIKPSNILVTLHDGVAVPKVIDFGIAKATQQELTDKTVFTQFKQFLGTPAYISPEQAEMSGLDIDTRSDIYSLGVLLYELLTGTTPFDARELIDAGLEGMRRIICEKQPPRPSTRLTQQLLAKHPDASGESKIIPLRAGQKSKIGTDLDWIVMKCLEKDRARRYETANGLARDIERHLNNEPVLARPPSRLYEFRKTVRRHWVGFAAVIAVVLALGIGVLVSTWQAIRANQAREQAQTNEQKALAAKASETTQRERAEADEQLGRSQLYASKMNLAQAAWEQNRVAQVRQLLKETADYPDRGFEWYYWQRQTHLELKTLRGHTDMVDGVAYSPNGRWIVTGSMDTTAKVWDAASFKELFSLKGHLHDVPIIAFSRDNQRIVTGSGDGTARIWDSASGRCFRTLEGHKAQIAGLGFSPNGSQVVTGSWDGTARVWDAASGNELFRLEGHPGRVQSAVFSPDGTRILTAHDNQVAVIWDARGGTNLLTIRAHDGDVWYAEFSPDGQRIVTCGDDRDPTAKVWDATTGRHLLDISGHTRTINVVRFSADGQRIVTASDDSTAKVWDAVTGSEQLTIKGHTDRVRDVMFSPDGKRLVTASVDHTAKVWDATGNRELLTLKGHTNGVIAVGFSPDGQRIAACGGRDIGVWDAASGEVLRIWPGQSGIIYCLAFSPDSRRIVTGADQSAKVWDAASGRLLFALAGQADHVSRLAFSPDGQQIVTGAPDGVARFWDASSGKALSSFQAHRVAVSAVAFSPDGRRLATAGGDRTTKIWDLATGNELFTMTGHTLNVMSLAFSPDGGQIVTGSRDQLAKIWDADTGKFLRDLKGHSDEVRCVAFSPNGRRIVTSSFDQTAKVWDTMTGAELLTLRHRREVQSVTFSPDGQRILTGCDDSTAKVWDAATMNQMAEWEAEEKEAERREAELARQRAAATEGIQLSTAHDPGAIKRWLILGPLLFEGHVGADALAQQQVPDEGRLRPSENAHRQVGDSDQTWRVLEVDDYRINLVDAFRSLGPSRIAYLVSYIQSDSDQTGLLMKVGCETEAKVYLNGKQIYNQDKPRKFVRDQDVISGVELKAGLNVVVFKVLDEEDNWQASLRFTDAAGQPIKGIRVTLAPP